MEVLNRRTKKDRPKDGVDSDALKRAEERAKQTDPAKLQEVRDEFAEFRKRVYGTTSASGVAQVMRDRGNDI